MAQSNVWINIYKYQVDIELQDLEEGKQIHWTLINSSNSILLWGYRPQTKNFWGLSVHVSIMTELFQADHVYKDEAEK